MSGVVGCRPCRWRILSSNAARSPSIVCQRANNWSSSRPVQLPQRQLVQPTPRLAGLDPLGRAVLLQIVPPQQTFDAIEHAGSLPPYAPTQARQVVINTIVWRRDHHPADGFDLYFLALAHHRLGREEQARACLKQAQAWHERFARSLSERETEELRRFRAEAETVLRKTN